MSYLCSRFHRKSNKALYLRLAVRLHGDSQDTLIEEVALGTTLLLLIMLNGVRKSRWIPNNMLVLQAAARGSNIGPTILLLAIAGVLIYFYWRLIEIIAHKRGRSAGLWFFLSFIISPILVILLLLVLGETDEKHRERIAEEERIRQEIRGE